MSDDITLTPSEVEGLRRLLAAIATVEERGWDERDQMCHITVQTWHLLFDEPKRMLSRLAARQIEP